MNWKKIRGIIWNILIIIGLIYITEVRGLKQSIGLFLIYILLITFAPLLINSEKRQNFINIFMLFIRQIEMGIWKKPLDKENWKKKEFKNTKVKLQIFKKNG